MTDSGWGGQDGCEEFFGPLFLERIWDKVSQRLEGCGQSIVNPGDSGNDGV